MSPYLVEGGADGEGGHVVVAGGAAVVHHVTHRLVVGADLRVDLLLCTRRILMLREISPLKGNVSRAGLGY